MARTISSSQWDEWVRLEVRVHIVTGAASAAQNIVKCIKRCGVELVKSYCSLWLRQIHFIEDENNLVPFWLIWEGNY